MDILGLPKLQNVERKSDIKSQDASFSLQKNSDSVKSSPNSFSKQLEKTLDKKSSQTESVPKDKVNISSTEEKKSNSSESSEKPVVVKKQEYSRNEKINPPRPTEEDKDQGSKNHVLDSGIQNTQLNPLNFQKVLKNPESQKINEQEISFSNQKMDSLQAGIVLNNAGTALSNNVSNVVIPESKLLNPQLEKKVSPEVLPILKFMKAMASDFKIAPEKIMQALQELPENALTQKPQAAVTHLLQKLEIQPRQFTKAQILFNQMVDGIEQAEIQNRQQISSSENIAPSTKNLGFDRFDGKVENLKEIKNLSQEIRNQVPLAEPQVTPSDVSKLRMQNLMGMNPKPDASAIGAKTETLGQTATQGASLSDWNALMAQTTGGAPKTLVMNSKPSVQGMDLETLVSKMAIQRNQAENQSDFAELEDEDFVSEEFDKEILGRLAENGTDKNVNLQKVVDNILASNSPEVKQLNIDKLTEQTQILVQKGGGEMKVHLSPEGMGDVVLKVKVQDGQVGIQMTTDNHHAKKLLESSVSDLKMSLHDHKLNLDTIKVDVAEKMQDQFLNQNSDFKREDAREFLSQFRQHNDNFRQSMFQMGGSKAYQQSHKQQTDDIQPLQRTTSSSGRLHLVA